MSCFHITWEIIQQVQSSQDSFRSLKSVSVQDSHACVCNQRVHCSHSLCRQREPFLVKILFWGHKQSRQQMPLFSNYDPITQVNPQTLCVVSCWNFSPCLTTKKEMCIDSLTGLHYSGVKSILNIYTSTSLFFIGRCTF